MEDLKEILNQNQEFVKNWLKKNEEITPQIVFKDKKGDITVVLIAGEREEIKAILKIIEKTKPKWVVFITEGYMRLMKKKEDLKGYKHGELKERFESGDKSIKEVVVIQAYNKTDKLMRVIDKKTLKPISEDLRNFDGFLTISDVERVFW